VKLNGHSASGCSLVHGHTV